MSFSHKAIDVDTITVNTTIKTDNITSNGNVLSLPTTQSDTLVGRSTTDTLSNKSWGDNLNMGSNKIVSLGDPTQATDAVNKSYVDSVINGLDVKKSVKLASILDLDSNSSISGPIVYNNTGGSSGTGQITATLASSDLFTMDGVNLSSSDNGARILLKNQSSQDQNGIWTVTIAGTTLTLDRAEDFDSDSEVTSGAFTFVEEGTTNSDAGFALTVDGDLTIGTGSGSNIIFSQFSGAAQITAGTGMDKSGNTLNVNGSDTILANADNLEVKSSDTQYQLLISTGNDTQAAVWGSISLDQGDAVSGVLPISKGGTNTSSFSSGSRLIATNAGNTALEATSINPVNIQTKTEYTANTTDATETELASIATTTDSVMLTLSGLKAPRFLIRLTVSSTFPD